MAEYFVGQVIELRINTGIDLSGADSVKILYQRPNKTTGEWVGTVDGQEVVYNTSASDINMPKTWKMHVKVTEGATVHYGSVFRQEFKPRLT